MASSRPYACVSAIVAKSAQILTNTDGLYCRNATRVPKAILRANGVDPATHVRGGVNEKCEHHCGVDRYALLTANDRESHPHVTYCCTAKCVERYLEQKLDVRCNTDRSEAKCVWCTGRVLYGVNIENPCYRCLAEMRVCNEKECATGALHIHVVGLTCSERCARAMKDGWEHASIPVGVTILSPEGDVIADAADIAVFEKGAGGWGTTSRSGSSRGGGPARDDRRAPDCRYRDPGYGRNGYGCNEMDREFAAMRPSSRPSGSGSYGGQSPQPPPQVAMVTHRDRCCKCGGMVAVALRGHPPRPVEPDRCAKCNAAACSITCKNQHECGCGVAARGGRGGRRGRGADDGFTKVGR